MIKLISRIIKRINWMRVPLSLRVKHKDVHEFDTRWSLPRFPRFEYQMYNNPTMRTSNRDEVVLVMRTIVRKKYRGVWLCWEVRIKSIGKAHEPFPHEAIERFYTDCIRSIALHKLSWSVLRLQDPIDDRYLYTIDPDQRSEEETITI